MLIPTIISDSIIDDFLCPMVVRLEKQLSRQIFLQVATSFEGEVYRRTIKDGQDGSVPVLNGRVRIVSSDTAIPNRYKYELQCILDDDEALSGFSGLRTNGAVMIADGIGQNKYTGFAYTYNEWEWGKKFRDF